MYLNLKKDFFEYLFQDIDGYKISHGIQQSSAEWDNSLAYGEIEFDSFVDILNDLPYNQNHQTFYDLGSGTGKAVIAAALDGYFDRLIGIEILPEMCQASVKVAERFFSQIEDVYPDKKDIKIDFYCQDLFNYDFSDGDVIFVQATCMEKRSMEKLYERMLYLKPGSVVITTTKSLSDPFVVLNSKRYKMSWGNATIYFNILK